MNLMHLPMVVVVVVSCPTLVTSWTITCQAPLSMVSLGENTGAGCHFLLQGISLTQASNMSFLCLLHWKVDSLSLCHLGSP